MSNQILLKEFRSFLESSSKNTEQFGPELLERISVDTQLDEIISETLLEGKNVIIAGTAGSGKTHMLQQLDSRLSDIPIVELDELTPSGKFIRKVSDLTAVPEENYQLLLEDVENCKAVIVAANEGALLSAARDQSSDEIGDLFSEAVELLHRIQRGDRTNSESELVVIDAAGFDPSSNAVLEQLIALELVDQFMDSDLACDSCEDPQICIRRQTWKQLQSGEVRKRVGEIVSAASVNAEGFTFRSIWNFLADLLLGGECKSNNHGIPTSAWFWRLFNGDSIVSKHISELFPEYQFTIPHAESHLWYGDWYWFRDNDMLLDGLDLVPPNTVPCDIASEDKASLVYRWVKSQTLFLSRDNPFTSGMTTTDASGLWAASIEGRVYDLLQAINKYMLYGFSDTGTELNLWVDYSMEQRTTRPDGQISLGAVSPDDFEIARSFAVANSALDTPPQGARLFLRHVPTAASLSLTRETLSLISQGRSPRMVDRENTELDWELMNFFGAIAEKAAVASRLSVALFDFDQRKCEIVNWDVHPETPRVVFSQ